MASVHSNASICLSATTVTIQYLFPRCLPCLSRSRTHNQTSSATMDKCTYLRKYAFPDLCLLDFISRLVGTTTSQNIRHLFLTLCIQMSSLFRISLNCKRYALNLPCPVKNSVNMKLGIQI